MGPLKGCPPFFTRRGGPPVWPSGWTARRDPDLAGWRRERLPAVPDAAFIELAPDWACEVLSPSTALVDRRLKLPIYAREAVRHVWLVDPRLQLLDVLRLDGDTYRLVQSHGEAEVVRAEPFDAIELELGALWPRHPGT